MNLRVRTASAGNSKKTAIGRSDDRPLKQGGAEQGDEIGKSRWGGGRAPRLDKRIKEIWGTSPHQ